MKKNPIGALSCTLNLAKSLPEMGGTGENESIVFDSSGKSLQNVIAASIVYEKALRIEKGITLDFG